MGDFDNLSDRLRKVAFKTLSFCKERYGHMGLVIEGEISPSIGWRPSFQLKAAKFHIIAVEVDDSLYPSVLKGAAYDIGLYDFPISVYQACSLDAYQSDPKQARVNLLRKHGFGIITVDEDGRSTLQHPCIPLAQHISSDHFEADISGLSPKVKVIFKSAYQTYQTNEGQGLQQAGQVVEALVMALASEAIRHNVISNGTLKKPLAEVIDALYETADFKPHRAALGRARGFVKEFRNTASHAPKSAKQAAEKIRKCKVGFLESIGISTQLREVGRALSYKTSIHV